jgi:hypothetical protein
MTLHLYWPDNETPPCKSSWPWSAPSPRELGRRDADASQNAAPVFLPTASAASRVVPSAARRDNFPHRFSGVEDPGAAALHKDQLRASVLLERLRAAKARLVEGHPTIELQFGDIASSRECFALIWPEP